MKLLLLRRRSGARGSGTSTLIGVLPALADEQPLRRVQERWRTALRRFESALVPELLSWRGPEPVVAILTHLQVTRPHLLPEKLKDWSFLPRQLRSFEIVDYVVQTYIEVFCCCIVERTVMLSPLRNDEVIFFSPKICFPGFSTRDFQRQRDKNVLQLGLGANLQLVKTKK